MTTLRQLEAELGEVLAAHDQGHDLDTFSEYDGRPVAFADEVLGVELWAKQGDILRALEDHPQVLVHGGNSVGKDFVAGVFALYWTFVKRGLVLATASVERQVVDVFMNMTVGRLWRPVPELPGELLRNSLRIPGEEAVGIVSFTATAVERLTGYHADRVACVLTEAQGLEPFAWQGMQRSATGPEDRILAVGNPNSSSGRFRELAGRDNWHTVGISIREHPNVAEGETVIPGGPSPDFERRMAEDWGKDHPIFQSAVLGQFPAGDIAGLVEWGWLDAAAEAFQGDAFREDRWTATPTIGLDVARYGPDSTVACIRRGAFVERFVEWTGASTEETAERVRQLAVEAAARWNHDRSRRVEVVVDEAGIGGGVVDALEARKLRNLRVKSFNGGSSARDKSRYVDKRAETFWALRERIEDGEIALPRDRELFEELATLHWELTPSGKIKMEPKAEWSSRISASSPDRADALSLAYAADAEPQAGGTALVAGI